MRVKMKKIVTSLLILSLLAFCSCIKNDSFETAVQAPGDVDITVNRERVIIEDDGLPWYHASSYELEEEYNDYYHNQVLNNVISVDGTTLTTMVTGYEFVDHDDVGDFSNLTAFCHLVKYDFVTGDKLFFADLTQYHGYLEDDGISVNRECVTAAEATDSYFVLYRYDDYFAGTYEYRILSLDKESGVILQDTVTSLGDFIGASDRIWYSAVATSKMIFLAGTYESTSSPFAGGLSVVVYDTDTGEVSSLVIDSALNDSGMEVLTDVRWIDDEHYAIIGYTYEFVPVLVVLDIADMSTDVIDMSNAMSDITDDLTTVDYGYPSNTFVNALTVTGDDYIAGFNNESGRFEKLFDSDRCNVNSILFEMHSGAAYADEDRVVLVNGLSQALGNGGALGVYLLERLDGNPYAGRTLLTASALSRSVAQDEAEVICLFNDAQEQYYVAIDNSYAPGSAEDYYYDYENYVDETSLMTAGLAVDLIAGDGPDIILDGFEYDEISNGNCLIDLMPYLEGSDIWDDSLYFSNAFELARDDSGALYQIPTSIMLSGIQYRVTSGVDSEETGFTFEEYQDFVNGEWNGFDPVSLERERIDYFVLCFNAMRSEFISGGQIDLDNEDFRALAQYCLDYVNGPFTFEDLGVDLQMPDCSYVQRFPLDLLCNGYSLRGLPSPDGRGPSICAVTSVGVASSCSCVEGAVAFVEYCLEEDSQQLMTTDCEPLLISAILQKYYDLIQVYEIQNEIILAQNPTSSVLTLSYDGVDEGVRNYGRLIDNSSGYVGGDSGISVILYEEMPAYFCGDKNLDDVISIIEGRAQTILDERS